MFTLQQVFSGVVRVDGCHENRALAEKAKLVEMRSMLDERLPVISVLPLSPNSPVCILGPNGFLHTCEDLIRCSSLRSITSRWTWDLPVRAIPAALKCDRFSLNQHNLSFCGVQVFSVRRFHDLAWSLGSSTYVTRRPNVKSISELLQRHALRKVSNSTLVPAGLGGERDHGRSAYAQTVVRLTDPSPRHRSFVSYF
jgi:hypothetical protein